MPDYVQRWLESGDQSANTDRIRDAAMEIGVGNRRARLQKVINYVMRHFSYNDTMNTKEFEITSGELYERKLLSGCSDYALVFISLFRASGIPARLVFTMNVDWIADYKKKSKAMPAGHCFIEVYLEDRWYLFDPELRWLYTNYRPDNRNYPRNEYFVKRGRDFWDMGIHSVKDAVVMRAKAAQNYQAHYARPAYDILKFNPDEFAEIMD